MRAGVIGVTAMGVAALGAVAARSDTAPSPQSAVTPASAPIAPLPQAADQCGASDLADLVGKPRTEIPVPVDPSHRRVYCTTCMVTQDYDPMRLDIVFDAQTGIIKEVKCG